MMLKNKKIMRCFTTAFAALFLFISTFANCLHTHYHEECASGKSSCSTENQTTGIIVATGEHIDREGDCPACFYLLSAQGAYFDSISLPGKQEPGRYSVSEPKSFHNNHFIENLARAPPYFIA
jgi:hypothetical protein